MLALTATEFRKGLAPARCPECRDPMKLRIAEAEGRTPKRLVWRCFKTWHRPPGNRQREIELTKMPRPKLTMTELITATKKGAVIDYQRLFPWSDPEPVFTYPTKARKRNA